MVADDQENSSSRLPLKAPTLNYLKENGVVEVLKKQIK
jgi:hypothetical protein